MPRLADMQEEAVDAALRIASEGLVRLPNLLLLGPSGCGKRTVAQEVARRLELEFVEVVVADTEKALMRRLVGDVEMITGEGLSHRGILGELDNALLFLSAVESLPAGMAQWLHELITLRKYTDGAGNRQDLSDGLWVVASYTSRPSPLIAADHWLLSSFQRRVDVLPIDDPDQLLLVADGIAADIGSHLEGDVIEIIASVAQMSGHLRGLKRVIEHASQRAGRTILAEDLSRAMARDLQWLLSRLVYRGNSITEKQLWVWLRQFPQALRPLATVLVRNQAERYFVSQADFYASLARLIAGVGIGSGAAVTFGAWQEFGQSAPRVAYTLRNQAGWRKAPDIDLSAQSHRWPLPEHVSDVIVIADDFVASGGSLQRLVSGRQAPLPRVLQRYPGKTVCLLFIVGYEEPLRRAREQLRPYGGQVRLIVDRILTDSDRCFTPTSSILPRPQHREMLERFCEEAGRELMPRLHPTFRLGFGGVGSLIVFHDNVPNNTLAIFWYTGDQWKALFPAAGLPIV